MNRHPIVASGCAAVVGLLPVAVGAPPAHYLAGYTLQAQPGQPPADQDEPAGQSLATRPVSGWVQAGSAASLLAGSAVPVLPGAAALPGPGPVPTIIVWP